MDELQCTDISGNTNLSEFNCGNSSVNNLLRKAPYRHALHQARTVQVCLGGQLLGVFTLSISNISMENTDTHMADHYEDDPTFGAVKLDYIAVDHRIQNRGIGTRILAYVVTLAQMMYRDLPVRVLILDALRDKVPWYTRCGFEVMDKRELQANAPTVRMFLDLMPENEKMALDMELETYS